MKLKVRVATTLFRKLSLETHVHANNNELSLKASLLPPTLNSMLLHLLNLSPANWQLVTVNMDLGMGREGGGGGMGVRYMFLFFEIIIVNS